MHEKQAVLTYREATSRKVASAHNAPFKKLPLAPSRGFSLVLNQARVNQWTHRNGSQWQSLPQQTNNSVQAISVYIALNCQPRVADEQVVLAWLRGSASNVVADNPFRRGPRNPS
jgi:hypothetical protein